MLYIIVHFLLNVYFNELLLAIYFICILDYGNNVRQKQIPVIFLFKFKMGHKQWRQLTTSTTHLAQELLMNMQWSSDSRSFAKIISLLQIRRVVVGHWKLTNSQMRESSKLILLQLHEKLPENLASSILWSFGIWSRLERWKSLVKWMPHELTANQKKLSWSVIVSCSTQQWTISWSDCDVQWKLDCIQQLVTTSSAVGLRKSSKVLSNAKLAPRKGSWSLFSGLLLVWFTTAFFFPSKTITSEKYAEQVVEMHQKLRYLQPTLVNRKGPALLRDSAQSHVVQAVLQKVNKLGY